jgi:hypothetical protein
MILLTLYLNKKLPVKHTMSNAMSKSKFFDMSSGMFFGFTGKFLTYFNFNKQIPSNRLYERRPSLDFRLVVNNFEHIERSNGDFFNRPLTSNKIEIYEMDRYLLLVSHRILN